MTKSLTVFIIASVLPVAVLAQQKLSPSVLKELENTEKTLFESFAKGDSASFRKISGADYLTINSGGIAFHQEEGIKVIPLFRGSTFVRTEQESRVYGNFVLRKGRLKIYRGEKLVNEYLYTIGWTYRDKRWQFVHWQNTTSVIADTVVFKSGSLELRGFLYKPEGKGPFPTILFNHGSEARPQNYVSRIATVFIDRGYAFFVPFRRGQGLSQHQGKYIVPVLDSVEKTAGFDASMSAMMTLHETEQLQDQLSALRFLKSLPEVDTNRIAVVGISFGGQQAMLIATQRVGIKCAVDFAGASMSWDKAPQVAEWFKSLAPRMSVPIYFIQAENDFSIRPSIEMSAALKVLNKPCDVKIYPPVGVTAMDGHSMINKVNLWTPDVIPWIEKMMSR